MAVIKRTCLLVLAVAWVCVLSRNGYTDSALVGGWTEQNPQGDPKYIKLAHYAVSTQTADREVYDTVVDLISVATQVVAGVNYNLTFTTAPTACNIGQVDYSVEECVPVGPVNGKCSAIVYEVPWMNTTEVTSYTCSDFTE
ncbi:cystatin-2-like [Dermacentor albipictus]|uniref:cystatin-2-like n=1 Tax=Dermacentor albipictus TaxID=60249 RepID=UPI0038FC75B5